jgi:AraC-like DNA-binding protein
MARRACNKGNGDRRRATGFEPRANPGIGQVGGRFLAHFKQLAISLGRDPVLLLKAANIHRRHLDDPELTLPQHAIVKLIETAANVCGVEDFGVRLAEVCGLPDLGPVGIFMREEVTVRNAIQTMIDLHRTHAKGSATVQYLEEGKHNILKTEMLWGDDRPFRQTIDMCLAFDVQIIRSLLGRDWAPLAVCFVRSKPTSRRCFERAFRCSIYFDHEFNGIMLRRSDLDTRLTPLSSVLRWQMDRFFRAIDILPDDAFVHRATRIIAMTLPAGHASATNVARSLDIDRRTLNRRLARSGFNYSALVKNVRRNLAIQHLMVGERPLQDIGVILGFSSPSTFTRWFRAVFGCSPRCWRNSRQTT